MRPKGRTHTLRRIGGGLQQEFASLTAIYRFNNAAIPLAPYRPSA